MEKCNHSCSRQTLLCYVSEASAVTKTQKALKMEYFFDLLRSSELYFIVVLTGMRQKMTQDCVKISPLHSAGAWPEAIVTLALI